MHEFPPVTELQFLLDQEVGQIALDPHSVQLRWADGGQITVSGNMEQIEPDGTVMAYDCTAYAGPPLLLHRLLQQKINGIEQEPHCLTLRFANGAQLRLFSQVGPYEDGLIQFTDNLEDGYIVY